VVVREIWDLQERFDSDVLDFFSAAVVFNGSTFGLRPKSASSSLASRLWT
jgi:hypothetical protein